MANCKLDLGGGYYFQFTSWKPDRKLNPKYSHLPDVPKFGGILTCPHTSGYVTFDTITAKELFPKNARWKVLSLEPLTLEPSIQTGCCHGYIREGKWISA
jgi:hypothetical protein